MCDKELTASLESPARRWVTVKVAAKALALDGVRARSSPPVSRVVTTTRPLKRAGIIEPQDVTLRERDISLINQGFLTSVDQAIGQKLTRPTVTDQVITLVHLEQAEVIRKGDQVVIIARSGTLRANARRSPGQRRPERTDPGQNLNSNRVIKAQVTRRAKWKSPCKARQKTGASPALPKLCRSRTRFGTCGSLQMSLKFSGNGRKHGKRPNSQRFLSWSSISAV
jgi:flagella basal body P-ring formation protein FlgA